MYSTERSDVQFRSVLAQAESAGWKTFEIPMVRAINLRADFACAVSLRRVIADFIPDVIHAHSSKAGALVRATAATLIRKPRIIYSPHAISSDSTVHRTIERLLSAFTTRFIAVSNTEKQQLLALGLVSSERIDVADPIIDGDHFFPLESAAAKRALGYPEHSKLLVAIGRLSEQKNPLEFLEIALRLRHQHEDLRAVWVGDGLLRDKLQSAIDAAHATEWFIIAGWKDDVRPYLGAADLFISTSRYESFGYVTAEALAMKRLVLATNVVGTSDILSGPLKSLMYEAGNLTQAIDHCGAIFDTPEQFEHLKTIARDAVLERFSKSRLRAALTGSYTAAMNREVD